MVARWVDAKKKLPPLNDYEGDRSDSVLMLNRFGDISIGFVQYDPEWTSDPEGEDCEPPEWRVAGSHPLDILWGEILWWAPLPPGPPIAEGYTIEIGQLPDQPNYGWFENDELGGGGGLWFEGDTLVDYDCVFALPPEVVAALRRAGYTVDDDCLLDDEDAQKARDLQ